MAMENGAFISDFPTKTFIDRGFSIAIENGPVEIVSFPMKIVDLNHSYVNTYQVGYIHYIVSQYHPLSITINHY